VPGPRPGTVGASYDRGTIDNLRARGPSDSRAVGAFDVSEEADEHRALRLHLWDVFGLLGMEGMRFRAQV
jgi:hypothetical protein